MTVDPCAPARLRLTGAALWRDHRRFDMEHSHESLKGFPVVIALPVLWGDQDAFGHVNNLRYMGWAETARVEYLVRIGLWATLPPDGVGPILVAVSCDFKRPVTYPDTVLVGARVTRIGDSSIGIEHRIVSQSLNEVVAEVDSTIVVLDYSRMKSVRVPEHVRKAIESLEGRVFEAPLSENGR
jgi:acyl-CoA thioester hydrolase